MSNNKQSSVEWLIDNIYLKDSLKWCEIIEQAKQMHKEEHSNTWDKSVDNYKKKDENYIYWVDFDDYYKETFGGNNE